MKLVLAEKPSVAQSIAKVLGAAKREDGYLEGNGYVVSWCVGHLVELAQPEVYDRVHLNFAMLQPYHRCMDELSIIKCKICQGRRTTRRQTSKHIESSIKCSHDKKHMATFFT